MQVFAYAEAVQHSEQALRTQEVLDPDDKQKRCDLLLAQAEAMLPLEAPQRIASTVAEEAFGLAVTCADARRAARASIIALEALWRQSRGSTVAVELSRDAMQQWAARADAHAETGTADRVYADVYLGIPGLSSSGPAAAHQYLRRAVERAQSLGDNGLIFAASGWALSRLSALRDWPLVDRIAKDIRDRPRDGARSQDLGQCLYYGGHRLLVGGDRAGAETLWGEFAQLADRIHDATQVIQARLVSCDLLCLDGRLEDALAAHRSAATLAEEFGFAPFSPSPRVQFLLGRLTPEG